MVRATADSVSMPPVRFFVPSPMSERSTLRPMSSASFWRSPHQSPVRRPEKSGVAGGDDDEGGGTAEGDAGCAGGCTGGCTDGDGAAASAAIAGAQPANAIIANRSRVLSDREGGGRVRVMLVARDARRAAGEFS